MMRLFKYSLTSNYDKQGHCIRCPDCHSHNIESKITDHIDGLWSPASEIEYYCADCEIVVAYWAYGSYDPYFQMGERSIPALIWRIKNNIRHSWDEFLKDIDLRDDPFRRL